MVLFRLYILLWYDIKVLIQQSVKYCIQILVQILLEHLTLKLYHCTPAYLSIRVRSVDIEIQIRAPMYLVTHVNTDLRLLARDKNTITRLLNQHSDYRLIIYIDIYIHTD